MKIRIEEEIYSGSPSFIMEQLWENSFDKSQFPDLNEYVEEIADTFSRVTDVPCILPEGTLDIKAEALIRALSEIDVLEVLEDA